MTSGVAPMRPQDASEVAALFYKVFRSGGPPPPEFLAYFEDSFFGAPFYDEAQASQIYRNEEGRVTAAILAIPMQVRCGDTLLLGRLASNFMADPDRPSRGAAGLVMSLRMRHQDFCFSDSCNEVSARHWQALGCEVLPLQSLDWRRLFRPASVQLHRFGARLPRWLAAPLGLAARPLDALIRRVVPGLAIKGPGQGGPMTPEAFIAEASALLDRFTLRPVWSPDELGWLIAMAVRNTIDGPLQFRQLRDADGQLRGCTVFYARPGGMARILNCLAHPGAEIEVLDDLLFHLDAMGCAGARGMAQPFLMGALRIQRFIGFVPRGAYGLSTRHPEILDAIRRGDACLGGLMGEDWSRLLNDFPD